MASIQWHNEASLRSQIDNTSLIQFKIVNEPTSSAISESRNGNFSRVLIQIKLLSEGLHDNIIFIAVTVATIILELLLDPLIPLTFDGLEGVSNGPHVIVLRDHLIRSASISKAGIQEHNTVVQIFPLIWELTETVEPETAHLLARILFVHYKTADYSETHHKRSDQNQEERGGFPGGNIPLTDQN
jgi:hypothetical protein